MNLPISQIIIGERQRDAKDLEDLSDLDSMSELGQLQPIGVRNLATLPPSYELIWGRRRLAKAVQLGWTTIEAVDKGHVPELLKQEMELIEDIARKERSWQDRCRSVAKLYWMKNREKKAIGENWTVRMMAAFTSESKSNVGRMLQVGEALVNDPEGPIAQAPSYVDAVKEIYRQVEKRVTEELNARRAASVKDPFLSPEELTEILVPKRDETGEGPPLVVPPGIMPLSLQQRCDLYNLAFNHLGPPNTSLEIESIPGRQFAHAHWFVGGGNISELYGSYQVEYLKRIVTLFPDAQKVVHLFSGSLPYHSSYTRVGLPQDGNEPDVVCDAHNLSSVLKFKPDLIYADPPYSVEDSQHYDNSMVNETRVLDECAEVLEPGGYIVWMSQTLPVFSNEKLQYIGHISYIRSTGNRLRGVMLFRKHLFAK